MRRDRRGSRGRTGRLYTVGHSTRTVEDLIALLRAHGVEQLVDVRTIPRSRRNPQFNRDALRAGLKRARLRYRHLPALGGLRRAVRNSVNQGWRNASFRGFADYMATADFACGIDRLTEMALRRPTAIMCAEAVPWRCHRSLIADALTARGWEVRHIQSRKTAGRHEPTPFLRIRAGRLVYPAPSSADARGASGSPRRGSR